MNVHAESQWILSLQNCPHDLVVLNGNVFSHFQMYPCIYDYEHKRILIVAHG